MHLIILGALPPPRGGVTTHIERLIPYLEEAGIKFVVWDRSNIRKTKEYVTSIRREPIKAVLGIIKQRTVKVLYCPLSNITASKTIFLLFMRMIGIRITVSLTASPEQTIGKGFFNLICMVVLARMSTHIIATNRDFKKLLIDKGIANNKVSVISAFIPPKKELFEGDHIVQGATDFCIKHKPLIVTYAYGPDLHKGEDLYGLDLIVGLAQKLRTVLLQVGFLAVIPEISNQGYFEKLKNNIEENGLEPFFHFAIGNRFSFVPFLQYADLFIRATNTDGDALTLREALYFGIPSVASDVCHRPEGTILFCNRDANDLLRAVQKGLQEKRRNKSEVSSQDMNNAALFIDIFKRTAGLRE